MLSSRDTTRLLCHLARGQVDEIFMRTLLEDILPTAAPEFAQTTEDNLTECAFECSMPSSRLFAQLHL